MNNSDRKLFAALTFYIELFKYEYDLLFEYRNELLEV